MDPAAPFIASNGPDGRLDETDGHCVDIIHSSSQGLSMTKRMGHRDFYPCGARDQYGCDPNIPAQQQSGLFGCKSFSFRLNHFFFENLLQEVAIIVWLPYYTQILLGTQIYLKPNANVNRLSLRWQRNAANMMLQLIWEILVPRKI